MIISVYRSFFLFLAGFLGEGWAIVALSCICSALMAPLMKAVAGVVRREAAYQEVIIPQIARIKETFPGDMERNLHIQRLYRRYGYSPLSAVKKVLPLFVQIPFLLLTYYMLKGTVELNGVQFLFLKDLGKPDALLSGINLLPFVMTGVNLLTVAATSGFTKRDQTQAVGISLLFLVLLYTAPSALLLYWTLNNVITMVRTFMGQHCRGVKLLASRVRSIPAGALNEIRAFRGPVLLRALAGFFGVSLLVLLPLLYFLFAIVPQNLQVEVLSEAPISVRADEANDGFSVQLSGVRDASKVQRYREFLPPDVEAKRVSYTFNCSVLNRIVIKRIRLTIADMFAYDLSAQDVLRDYEPSEGSRILEDRDGAFVFELVDGKGTLSPKNCSRFGKWAGVCPTGVVLPRWVFRVMIYLSFALMIFSLAGARFFRMDLKVRRVFGVSCALAFVAAAFLLLVLPAQSFWANRGDYSFTAIELLWSQIPQAILVGIVLTLGLCLSCLSFWYWPHIGILIFLAYEYLQTGILSINAPTMNGDMVYYANGALALRDLLVLAVIGGAFTFGCRFFVRHMGRIIAILSAVIGVTFICSIRRSSTIDNSSPLEAGYRSKLFVLKNVTLSERNVIVLVLDSITTEVVSDILANCPELSDRFSGFTFFENNIGMHHETDYATVGILTGKYYLGPVENTKKESYLKEVFNEDSALRNYISSDGCVNFVPSAYDFGVLFGENVSPVDYSGDHNKKKVPIKQCKEGALSFSLRDLSIFRLAPFAGKQAVFELLYACTSGHGRCEDEETVYPILESANVSRSSRTSFLFVHTHGAHCPHDVSRDGRRFYDGLHDGYDRFFEHSYFVLSRVASLFDAWKKRGIYDSSYIVVLADHGSHGPNDTRCPDGDQNKLPPRAYPFLCVKPFNANGKCDVDEVSPTHHANLHRLLKTLADRDCSIAETKRLLISPDRLFVIPEEGCSSCWRVDERGAVVEYKKE